MPQTYTITDPKTGRSLTVRGDGGPPTEHEIEALFAAAPAKADAPKPGIMERAADWLPAAGGTLGGILGGIPGAAAGGAAGEGFRKLAKSAGQLPGAVADIVRNMATPEGRAATAQGFDAGSREGAQDTLIEGGLQGGAQAVGAGVAKGAGAAGRFLADTVAGRAVQAAVKPAVSQLKMQAGASLEGLTGSTKRLTDILLKHRWTNAGQAQQAVAEAEQAVQHAVKTDPNATFQPLLDTARRVPAYLAKLTQSAAKQAIPGADVSAIEGAADGVIMGPLAQDVMRPGITGFVPGRQVPTTEVARAMRANLTPEEGLEIARATGKWGNQKAWGELKGAEQEASKNVERAIRDSIKDAVPATRKPLEAQSEALSAIPVLDRMKWRQGNRDVLGLPAWVMAGPEVAAGHVPIGAILANLARSGQLQGGYAAHTVGNALKAAASHGASKQVPAAGARALIESMRQRER